MNSGTAGALDTVDQQLAEGGDWPEREAALWARWRECSDNAAREELVSHYAGLVKIIALSVYRTASYGYVDLRDLIQLGTVGLLESIERFDPAFGSKFSSFADKRIRGAILNGLESQSELHAQQAFKRRFRKERLESLKEGVPVKGDVFAEMVELTVGLAVGHMLEHTAMYAASEQSPSQPADGNSVTGFSRLLRRLLDHLPGSERNVLTHHYLNGVSFSDIAKLLGLTKGRISQLHAAGLARIRKLCRELRDFDLTA